MEELSWISLRDRLVRERDRFQEIAPSLAEIALKIHPELVFEWFVETNETTQDAIGDAVEQYFHEEKWPELSEDEKAFLLLRIEWALGLADAMSLCPGLPPPDMDTPEEHVLKWSLLTAWDKAGLAQTLVALDLAAHSLQGCLAELDGTEGGD